jgi:hypothetical protein
MQLQAKRWLRQRLTRMLCSLSRALCLWGKLSELHQTAQQLAALAVDELLMLHVNTRLHLRQQPTQPPLLLPLCEAATTTATTITRACFCRVVAPCRPARLLLLVARRLRSSRRPARLLLLLIRAARLA